MEYLAPPLIACVAGGNPPQDLVQEIKEILNNGQINSKYYEFGMFLTPQRRHLDLINWSIWRILRARGGLKPSCTDLCGSW